MIALIEGTVVEKSEGEAIVMTAGGVGYRLMCSMNTLSSLPAAGDKCRLYTHLNVREDAMELYGFLQTEEREMFRRLIAISGIGARSALQILGSMPLQPAAGDPDGGCGGAVPGSGHRQKDRPAH